MFRSRIYVKALLASPNNYYYYCCCCCCYCYCYYYYYYYYYYYQTRRTWEKVCTSASARFWSIACRASNWAVAEEKGIDECLRTQANIPHIHIYIYIA